MAISFENANKPVTWGDLVNYLAALPHDWLQQADKSGLSHDDIAHQIRQCSFHPTTYVLDEAAHIPEGEECLGAVRPSGARIVCISTAAPGWFADQCTL